MFRLSSLFIVLALAIPAAQVHAARNDNAATLQKFYDQALNQGQLDKVDEFLAPNFVEHETLPNGATDRDGVKQFFAMLRTAYPDLKFTVGFMMSDGDKVAAYVTMTGTQKGEFMGFPASGKPVSVHLVDIIRFSNGKAVEHWGAFDAMTMMQQIGAVPAPPAAKQ